MINYLVGAEQVQNAAYSIRESVEQFKIAVGWLDDALVQHARRQEEYLARLETVLREAHGEPAEVKEQVR